ncbi:MAG: hypothetical protein JST54_07850 [Deltaproteobacteria bacterium]|nr:hypothetical protein [Deltaproteobacteria bacterium]
MVRLSLLVLALGLAGCGSGIGDACTTDQDCGGRTCSHAGTFPGGYCTEHCTPGDSSTCPTGSECIDHHGEGPICLRACNESVECRSGYTCHGFKNQGPFCLSPDDG